MSKIITNNIGKVMIYVPKDGTKVVFDDFVDNTEEYGSYWAELCECCLTRYKEALGARVDSGGGACGTCSVVGCNNGADYYVDFAKDEVVFQCRETEMKTRQDAVEVLNFYRNLHYADAAGTESRELADAINEILPHYVSLCKEG